MLANVEWNLASSYKSNLIAKVIANVLTLSGFHNSLTKIVLL